MESLAWMSMPLDKLALHVSKDIEDAEERKELVEHIKTFMHAFFDIQFHVLRQFPELNPDGKGEEAYFQAKVKYQANGFPPQRLSEQEIKSAEEAGLQAAREIQLENSDKSDE
jgi:hypothetical protein